MKSLAIVAITEKGCILGEKIASEYSKIDLLTINNRNNWSSKWKKLSSLVDDNFNKYDGFIFIMALGIVVRMISKHIVSKDSDPAIVVVDEQGQNTISLLSGHLGGGNKLTEELTNFLNNNSVITTATDVNNIYALDSFACDYGLIVDPIKDIKIFNKSLLEGNTIFILTERGIDIADKENIEQNSQFRFFDLNSKNLNGPKSLVGIISNKIYNKKDLSFDNFIYLRPKNIILGVGCKKNYPSEIFENNILKHLIDNNISIKSIKEIRSIHLKKEETAIVEFSSKFKIPFKTFSANQLNYEFTKYPDLKRSDFVYRNTGTYGVAEPSALVSDGAEVNLISKRSDLEGMTLAISEESPIIVSKINTKWLRRN